LKLKYDGPLSSVGFKLNLRRYTLVSGAIALVFNNRRGEAVQLDPMQPTLKAPISKRLKLTYDDLLSNFAFKFNLRRYAGGWPGAPCASRCHWTAAGAYTRSR
jgi:hypothetical protein